MGVSKAKAPAQVMGDLLREVLEQRRIVTYFQPIVDLKTADILGYEALSRGPEGHPLHSPVALIEQAENENCLWALEALFRETALASASRLGLDKLLFLNVDPNVVRDPKFISGFTRQSIQNYRLQPENIVFEITERSAIDNFKSFLSAMMHYGDQGYKTAIDDTGAGYSNMSVISKLKPEFIKIDMELVRDIDRDSFKQAIIKSFVWLANLTGSMLIAEGIETLDEARTLGSLGVHAGQGYLLARPAPQLGSVSESVRLELQHYRDATSYFHTYTTKYIGEISDNVRAFDQGVNCVDIRNYLHQNDIEGACILQGDNIAGLIMRNRLDAALSAQYGFSLYAHRAIHHLMDRQWLSVDFYTPISVVSEMALTRAHANLYDNIIVTRNFRYAGMVSVINLLQHSSEIERSFALELNPLTGLPGNIQINKMLYETITGGQSCSILYVDLDNFKVYNDNYGFQQGDSIIKMTRDVVCRCVKAQFQFSSFVGHIGGDDFIAVVNCAPDDCELLCRQILADFDAQIQPYFNETDLNRGYMLGRARTRSREVVAFPLTSMTIAAISGVMNGFETPDQLSYELGRLKNSAKTMDGSNYLIQRVEPAQQG